MIDFPSDDEEELLQAMRCLEGDEIQKAIDESTTEDHELEEKFKLHAQRLEERLLVDDLIMLDVPKDGDCFFRSLSMLTRMSLNEIELRERIIEEMFGANEVLYRGFNTCFEYSMTLPGHWNSDFGDLFPLAAANSLNATIVIYSSHSDCPAPHIITPTVPNATPEYTIHLVHFAIENHEHYNPCVPKKDIFVARVDQCGEVKIMGEDTINESDDVQETCEDNTKKRKKINQRQERKKSRNTGQAYRQASGTLVPSRHPKAVVCNCKHGFKCQTLTEDDQIAICREFWELGDYTARAVFIIANVHEKEKKISTTKTPSKRHMSREYFLPIRRESNDEHQQTTNIIRVCKQTFLDTLCISSKLVQHTLEKRRAGNDAHDSRGKHRPGNKMSSEMVSEVRQHILSFPRVASHYCRASSSKQYLQSNLTLRKMYELYKQNTSGKVASEVIYRKEFRKFNFSFHKPKKDTCVKCFKFHHIPAKDKSETDKEEHQKHLDRKTRARQEKEEDKIKAAMDKSKHCVTFDLQKVLDTPSAEAGPLFYKRKLSVYNLTFFNLDTKLCQAFIWDETEGHRGANEIASCVLHYLSALPASVSEVILYSDSCMGQNKNMFMTSMLHNFLQSDTSIITISQKYLEPGHTQMEVDSVHSVIERAKKGVEVFIPRDWTNIIKKAKKTNPYMVTQLHHTHFKDAKHLVTNNKYNLKVLKSGKKVDWRQIRWIRVTKGSGTIDFRYEMEGEWLEMDIRMKKTTRRSKVEEDEGVSSSQHTIVPPCYDARLPISAAKYTDLVDLCKHGTIPMEYHSFYHSLPVDKVEDKLAESDMDEEDSEDV